MGQWRGGRDSRLSRVRGVPWRAAARHLRARTSRGVDAGSLVARQRSERAGRSRTVGPPDRRSGSTRHRSRLEHRRWRRRTHPSHRFSHLRPALSFDVGPVDRVVLAGWSLGASAALDLVCHPELVGGWRPGAVVAISGGFDRSPFTHDAIADEWRRSSGAPSTVDPSIPLLLVHGSSDEIVPPERSVVTFARLLEEGWRVTHREVTTDHAGAIGTVFDPARQRCAPTTDPGRQDVLTTVAQLIADLALEG